MTKKHDSKNREVHAEYLSQNNKFLNKGRIMVDTKTYDADIDVDGLIDVARETNKIPLIDQAGVTVEDLKELVNSPNPDASARAKARLRQLTRQRFQEDMEKFYDSDDGKAYLRTRAEKEGKTYDQYKADFDEKVNAVYNAQADRARKITG